MAIGQILLVSWLDIPLFSFCVTMITSPFFKLISPLVWPVNSYSALYVGSAGGADGGGGGGGGGGAALGPADDGFTAAACAAMPFTAGVFCI